MKFTAKEAEALRGIVEQWIGEGFTTPPYEPEVYGIFEKLGITNEKKPSGGYELNVSYDIRRPE